jgi:hypothetical protein
MGKGIRGKPYAPIHPHPPTPTHTRIMCLRFSPSDLERPPVRPYAGPALALYQSLRLQSTVCARQDLLRQKLELSHESETDGEQQAMNLADVDFLFRKGSAGADMSEVEFDLFAGWRGPQGEFVDVRDHLSSFSFGLRLLHKVLQWRGPGNEFVDIRGSGDRFIDHKNADTTRATFELLLKWRGPNGEWYDAREMFTAYVNEHYPSFFFGAKFLKWKMGLFMDWRGPNNECVEFTVNAVNFVCHRSAKLVDAVMLWRGPGGEFADFRQVERWDAIVENAGLFAKLLQWRGPNGEFVDLRLLSLDVKETPSYAG